MIFEPLVFEKRYRGAFARDQNLKLATIHRNLPVLVIFISLVSHEVKKNARRSFRNNFFRQNSRRKTS